MLHVNNTRDLQQFGINVLTGEACSYGLRLLCDLTQVGVDLVSSFFGGLSHSPENERRGYPFPQNWNSGAIASVMLPRSILFSELAIFAMFRAGCSLVVVSPGGSITGVKPHEKEALALYQQLRTESQSANDYVFYTNRALQSVHGRNEHQFSGRTV
jgi:hypothetical protein